MIDAIIILTGLAAICIFGYRVVRGKWPWAALVKPKAKP